MQNKFSHKVFSVLMAFLVLLSTVSFTVEQRFCGDVLIDSAVFTEAQNCCKDASKIEVAKITKVDCCKDVHEVLLGQDQLNLTKFEDLSFDKQVFINAYVFSFNELYEALPRLLISHDDYSPPNLVADIHVLDQVFLI